MGWFDLPLFLWALYATGIIQILATPVLGITVALGFLERIFHLGIFMPEYGGDPVLFQHFFWFYSHPAVYIMILPAMGIVSEVVSVFSRKPIFGYRFIAMSSIAIARHRLPGLGPPHVRLRPVEVGQHHLQLPHACWWPSPRPSRPSTGWPPCTRGVIVLKTPMLYVLTFFAIFGVGGLTGLFLGALATDIPLHDTYFVVAHFHFVMVGAVMIAFLAGLHYWWPKMTGRMYDERLGVTSAVLVFLGFNLTFIPQFIAGVAGMPRRYATYAERVPGPEPGLHGGGLRARRRAGRRALRPAGLAAARRRGAPRPTPGAPPRWSGRPPPRPPPTTTSTRRPAGVRPYDFTGLRQVSEEAGWVRVGGEEGAR